MPKEKRENKHNTNGKVKKKKKDKGRYKRVEILGEYKEQVRQVKLEKPLNGIKAK